MISNQRLPYTTKAAIWKPYLLFFFSSPLHYFPLFFIISLFHSIALTCLHSLLLPCKYYTGRCSEYYSRSRKLRWNMWHRGRSSRSRPKPCPCPPQDRNRLEMRSSVDTSMGKRVSRRGQTAGFDLSNLLVQPTLFLAFQDRLVYSTSNTVWWDVQARQPPALPPSGKSP